LGYQFTCLPANINEDLIVNEPAVDYVKRLAEEKALAIANKLNNVESETTIVLGSDTSVVYESEILGKPSNLEECISHLQLLSGKTHQVLTSISAVCHNKVITKLVTTNVTFTTLTVDDITRYWNTGEPQDKAGSYGIQGIGGQFVTHLSGSYSAVVGLPLFETSQLLAQFGLFTQVKQPRKELS
jgi:septum formation protein